MNVIFSSGQFVSGGYFRAQVYNGASKDAGLSEAWRANGLEIFCPYFLFSKSRNSIAQGVALKSTRATVTGNRNRRGPALPGFR
jgi:hypothetical protein